MSLDLDTAIRELGFARDRYHRRWAAYWKAFDAPQTKAFWEACSEYGSYTAADYEEDALDRARWALNDMHTILAMMQKEYEKRDKRRRLEEKARALENTTGRTPEEAAAFLAKAKAIRDDERA